MTVAARSTVGVVRAADNGETARQALESLLELLGSPLAAVSTGDLVLIKPNMFQHKPGFLTNPHLLTAVAAAVADRGGRPVVGERTTAIHTLLAGSSIHRYAEVVSFDDRPLRIVQIERATSLRVPIALPDIVLDCDYFIGVPQLRTHSSMIMTGAMKNLIGLLPGYTTRVVHMAGVGESLVDLNVLRPQNLVVADAITIIEGNYPMAGHVRPTGLIVGATNAVAVDAVLATLAGIEPTELSYLADAEARGLGPGTLAGVDLVGAALDDVAFDIERAPVEVVAPRPGVHLHVDTACDACRRWIAAALVQLHQAIRAFPGELTIVSGPRERLPDLLGTVVLVGNATYEHRAAGVFIEGCPPRAIQIAALRYAMGLHVEPAERSQFRVPSDMDRNGPALPGLVGDDV